MSSALRASCRARSEVTALPSASTGACVVGQAATLPARQEVPCRRSPCASCLRRRWTTCRQRSTSSHAYEFQRAQPSCRAVHRRGWRCARTTQKRALPWSCAAARVSCVYRLGPDPGAPPGGALLQRRHATAYPTAPPPPAGRLPPRALRRKPAACASQPRRSCSCCRAQAEGLRTMRCVHSAPPGPRSQPRRRALGYRTTPGPGARANAARGGPAGASQVVCAAARAGFGTFQAWAQRNGRCFRRAGNRAPRPAHPPAAAGPPYRRP
jgi:hypothetical protein